MMKKWLILVAILGAVIFGLLARSRSMVERSVPAPAEHPPVNASAPAADSTPLAAPSDQTTAQPPASVRPAAPGPAPRDTTSPTPTQPQPTPAGQSAAERALKAASTAYAAVRSMRAEFAQWQDNPLLGKRTSSRGTVMQRQPDRFLLRFSQPAGDVIVGDGEYFWVYYPSVDAKQVLRTRAAGAGGLDLKAQFIGDPTRRFQFTDHGVEDVNGRPARAITLVPREAAGYKTLKVWIDERDHLVRRFELTNENDVVQHFDLSNLEINPQLSNDLFRFTPPANAQVIERAP